LFGDEFEKRAWRNFIKALVVFHFDMTGEEVNAPVGIRSCLTIKEINSQIYKKKNIRRDPFNISSSLSAPPLFLYIKSNALTHYVINGE
jgi:hypothetical protein